MTKTTDQLDIAPASEPGAQIAPHTPSPLTILEAAVRGGVTQENVAVVKELLTMAREQRAEEAKAAFAAAFFRLRKNMPEIYADKAAKDRNGNETFRYCSEEELSRMLEPHLTSYGFAMLFGQTEHDGRITVQVTLMHEAGHSETREFTVRAGQTNAMKDGAMCDAGAATTAWRHLMIKMFGLKSRIQENDLRTSGEKIGADKVQYLTEQGAELNITKFLLKIANVEKFEDVGDSDYALLSRTIEQTREARKRKGAV